MARQSAKRTGRHDVSSAPTAPAGRGARPETTTTRKAGSRPEDIDSAAEIIRTISELNEARMRLDTVVRKLVESTPDTARGSETATDIEALRLRLIGKLDQIREKLVVRLVEERRAKVR